jgi:DNA-binding CsgD family transcriptional regulator/predicted transcriptional regulator
LRDLDELSALDVALYRAALAVPGARVEVLAAAVDRSIQELDKSLALLTEMGLLRSEDGSEDGERFTAVSPMLAEATTLGVEDLDLNARRMSVETRRNAIRRLVPDWNDMLTARTIETDVDVIHDQAQLGNVLMHYADRCRDEVLSVSPGRLPKTRIDNRTRIANLYTLRRGARLRALYQHAALNDRHTRSYLTELADNGAKIRFAASVPGRSLVIDRDVALLPIPTGDPSRHGLAVVREPNVVAWVIATFEQLWAESITLEAALSRSTDDTEIDQTRAAILRLMAEGEKDEAISRRLSISVRTCRRQIAEYMAQVGATSRFQAGVIAARAGHLDPG